MKVTETTYLVGGGEPDYVFTDKMDCNVYLMRAGDLYVLIDAGGGMAPTRLLTTSGDTAWTPGR